MSFLDDEDSIWRPSGCGPEKVWFLKPHNDMSENAVVLKHLNNISMEAFRDFSSSPHISTNPHFANRSHQPQLDFVFTAVRGAKTHLFMSFPHLFNRFF